MAMIQGIDGNALINAFRAGKEDRFANMERQLQLRTLQAKADRQQQATTLLGQIYGGDTGGGLTNAYPSQPASPAPTDQAGQAPSAPQAQPRARAGTNYDALRQFATLDPENGQKLISAFKTMDELQLKQADAKNMAMAHAAHYLEGVPPAERSERMSSIVARHLMEAGWTPEEISAANLSDDGLKFYQARGMDLDKLLSAELEERKFQAGKDVAVQPGGAVINIKPDGTSSYKVVPFQMGGTQSSGTPSTGGVQEGATATNPQTGAKIIYRGGQWVPMGGGAGNGTGSFQP